jgi:hypothetical protein
MKIKPIGVTTEQFVKRAFALVYKACDPAMGWGLLQAGRVEGKADLPEDVIWKCVYNQEDYPGATHNHPGDVYGDYVFGRMMKWGVRFDSETIDGYKSHFNREYESFCDIYPDNKAIFDATAKDLGCTYVVVRESGN